MKYKCIKDFWMEDRLRENTPAFSNGNVYDFRPISVEEMRDGCSDLVTMSNNHGAIHYMPMSDINEYFELVEEKQEMTSTKTEQEIVVEWFNKYIYVVENDSTVDDRLYVSSHSRQLSLETDLTDIIGEDIYTFIVGRYNLLQTQEETKRKKELLDKRAELELQLAQINKELGE